MIRPSAVLAIVFLLATVLSAPTARACSCRSYDSGFLVPDEVEVPGNAVGLPWWGDLGWNGAGYDPPPNEGFRVEKLRDGEWSAMEFTVALLESELISSSPPPRYRPIVLVMPKGGLEAGRQYRFTYRPGRSRVLLPFGAEERQESQRIQVTVSSERFEPEGRAAKVAVGAGEMGMVTTLDRSGGCSTRFLGYQVPVKFKLPAEFDRWKDALLYTLQIEDQGVWRPAPSLCSPTPPGLSSIARAEELLFSYCGRLTGEDHSDGRGAYWSRPEATLPGGEHRLAYTAWLPGTGRQIVGKSTVSLICVETDPR
jgi:hypothetical protein